MLLPVLVVSLALLAAVLAVSRQGGPVAKLLVVLSAALVCPVGMMVLSLPVAVQAAVGLLALPLFAVPDRGPRATAPPTWRGSSSPGWRRSG